MLEEVLLAEGKLYQMKIWLYKKKKMKYSDKFYENKLYKLEGINSFWEKQIKLTKMKEKIEWSY